MKFLLVLALSLVASNSFAGAVEKFTSFVPVGAYIGSNENVGTCFVTVDEVNFPKKDIQVTVLVGNLELKKLIESGSHYGYKDFKKEFVQTERSLVSADESNYVERIIRTVSAGDKKQYVVVSYSTVVNRETHTETAECVIDL